MTTEELILNFSTQAKDLMKEIADYEQKLATAKEPVSYTHLTLPTILRV